MGSTKGAHEELEVPHHVIQDNKVPHAVQEDAVHIPKTDAITLTSSVVQMEMPALHQVPSSPTVHNEVWKKGGRLLSALLAINVGLIACVLVSSGSLEEVIVQDTEVLAFLVFLMLLSTVWMIFQFYFSCRKNAVLYKDSHAGPVWLRGGLVFFGICSLVLDVFKIGYYISYIDCESPIKLIHPMVQSAFIILQTYFLWVSSKHCVQIHTNISRYGLMLVLITNLSIWMAAVTDESVHQTRDLEDDLKELTSTSGYHEHRDSNGAHGHTCRCSNHLCHIFQTGYYYLYPFNIEYSLFASAMTYVMWKNVGRQMDDTMPCHHRLSPCFCFHSIFVGLIMGCIVLLGGIVALVTYKVKVNLADKSYKAHIMFYSFNIVVLSLMSMGSLAGSIIYRFDKRHIDGQKNPTRTLDVALLLGAALGQYCISYYSIVAMVATSPGELLNVLNLLYSLLMIIQLTLQNTFIIEGLHREPFTDEAMEPPKELIYSNEAVVPTLPDGVPQESTIPVTNNVENTMHTSENQTWNLKRRLVQEISLFLLLCNVILWLMPAFGARPQLKNNLELRFYGPTVWTIITNISLPFGIFYRMHGAASLLEVFRMS
ncbi:PREDICTED: otopetrin-2 [Nanorana parkeri]|uniref:otopetrin-2 n=1 Tax=Nanorana parkeri TaxID=125878 RepID=UPI000854AA69|nr:PREDICTED: otopetrin-2 [Nanorana parkeri]